MNWRKYETKIKKQKKMTNELERKCEICGEESKSKIEGINFCNSNLCIIEYLGISQKIYKKLKVNWKDYKESKSCCKDIGGL